MVDAVYKFSLDGGGFIRGVRATSTSWCVVVAEKHAKVGMKVCGGTRERETFHEPPLIPVSQQRLVDVVLGNLANGVSTTFPSFINKNELRLLQRICLAKRQAETGN